MKWTLYLDYGTRENSCACCGSFFGNVNRERRPVRRAMRIFVLTRGTELSDAVIEEDKFKCLMQLS